MTNIAPPIRKSAPTGRLIFIKGNTELEIDKGPYALLNYKKSRIKEDPAYSGGILKVVGDYSKK